MEREELQKQLGLANIAQHEDGPSVSSRLRCSIRVGTLRAAEICATSVELLGCTITFTQR